MAIFTRKIVKKLQNWWFWQQKSSKFEENSEKNNCSFVPQNDLFVALCFGGASRLNKKNLCWRQTQTLFLKFIQYSDDRELLNFAITAVNSFNILTAVGTKLNSSLSSLFWIHFDHSSWNKSTLIDSSCRSSNAKRRQLKLMTT